MNTHANTHSASTGPHQFDMSAWISRAPYEKLLGIEILKAEDGQSILQMPFVISLAQGAGLMHGGALVSLADTAVVMAIKSIVPPATHFATISMENRFLHPVKQGMVRAVARIAERDGRVLKGDCHVLDENDRTVMTFSSINKIARDATIRDIRFGDVPVSV